jgi:hypothetical protein
MVESGNEEVINNLSVIDDLNLYKEYIKIHNSSPHEITKDDLYDIQSGLRHKEKEYEEFDYLIREQEINTKQAKVFKREIREKDNVCFDIRDTDEFGGDNKMVKIVPHHAIVLIRWGKRTYKVSRYLFRNEYDRRIGKMRVDLTNYYEKHSPKFKATFG